MDELEYFKTRGYSCYLPYSDHDFFKKVLSESTGFKFHIEDSISLDDFAKIYEKEIKMDGKKLFIFLRDNAILKTDKLNFNKPFQEYLYIFNVSEKLFVNHETGETIVKSSIKVNVTKQKNLLKLIKRKLNLYANIKL